MFSQTERFIVSKIYEEDVQKEMDKIASATPADYVVRVHELRKIYGNGKVAVDRLSFGANYGECFGLLGVNGAGFKILKKLFDF